MPLLRRSSDVCQRKTTGFIPTIGKKPKTRQPQFASLVQHPSLVCLHHIILKQSVSEVVGMLMRLMLSKQRPRRQAEPVLGPRPQTHPVPVRSPIVTRMIKSSFLSHFGIVRACRQAADTSSRQEVSPYSPRSSRGQQHRWHIPVQTNLTAEKDLINNHQGK